MRILFAASLLFGSFVSAKANEPNFDPGESVCTGYPDQYATENRVRIASMKGFLVRLPVL